MTESLYKEEQKLLTKLVENESDKEYQNAIKRTISRLNKEMESFDEYEQKY